MATLLFHLPTTIARLLGPSGAKAIVAENLLSKHRLLVHDRSRPRSPNLSTQHRALLGFWALFISPKRIFRAAIIIKPSTLLKFHAAMKRRKYSLLYSARRKENLAKKARQEESLMQWSSWSNAILVTDVRELHNKSMPPLISLSMKILLDGFCNSPRILGTPHPTLMARISRINLRSELSMAGLPGLGPLLFQYQYRRKPAQCQQTTVYGCRAYNAIHYASQV